jgi:transcriptional regulator with XRE-family HTH domain
MLIDKDLVKNARQQRGWTQQQLADICDLNIRTIQRLEKTGVASMETSKALASVLEVTVPELLVDDRSVKPPINEVKSDKVLPYMAVTFLVAFSLGYWLG